MEHRPFSPYSAVPSKGLTIREKKQTVPDQGMSLKTILEKFVRGEKLSVAKPVSYLDVDYDVEKIAHGDLVDREAYSRYLSEIQKRYQRQERERSSPKTGPKADEPKAAAERHAGDGAAQPGSIPS